MKSNIQITRELLAQIDFQNTVNGGMANAIATGWKDKDGYRMILKAPSVDIENRFELKALLESECLISLLICVLNTLINNVQIQYHSNL